MSVHRWFWGFCLGIGLFLANFAQAGDTALCDAIAQQKGVRFIEADNIWIERLLDDDLKPPKHQRWIGRLSCGARILLVYNISLCERVPVQVGDRIQVGGELLFTRGLPLIHWLHEDPKNRRPHGYVILNGRKYGLIRKHSKTFELPLLSFPD